MIVSGVAGSTGWVLEAPLGQTTFTLIPSEPRKIAGVDWER